MNRNLLSITVLVLLLLLLCISEKGILCASPLRSPRMVENLVPWSPNRQELTLEYWRIYYDAKATDTQILPRAIVIHWTATKSLARHCIALNHCAIGIENVGGGPGFPLTSAQEDANIRLVADLKRRIPTITLLLGHFEYRRLENGPYWKELLPGYITVKIDPGSLFMKRVRRRLQEAGFRLQRPPRKS